jgi:predicted Zn-dependent peptidase
MKFKKTKLKNGLRIITAPMADNPTVTVLVLVETGSKYETKKLNGLSHFLEHMCFKGTAKRPKAIDISKELDALGAQYNAFTGQEYTGYYAKSDARHFKTILDIVSDIYLHSTLPEKEIEKEKGVIVEEINMYQDMPPRHVQDVFMELLYGDQPAGWNIAGTEKNVRAFKREDFVKYMRAHYVAESTIVIVAGRVSEAEAVRQVKKYFAPIKETRKPGKMKVIERQKKPAAALKFKKTDQTHLVLGVRSMDVYDKRNTALNVLASVLSGGMSSRLFQKLREEMGVGYYVRAGSDGYTDHGVLEVSAGVDNKRIDEVIKAILMEFRKLKNVLVPAAELSKVKEYMIGSLLLDLESSDSIASFYGGQEVLRKPVETAAEMAKKIRAVKAEDIRKLARQIFQNYKLNLALIGPYRNKARFIKILKI